MGIHGHSGLWRFVIGVDDWSRSHPGRSFMIHLVLEMATKQMFALLLIPRFTTHLLRNAIHKPSEASCRVANDLLRNAKRALSVTY